MDYKSDKKHMVDILFVLTLFFVFALSALTLVVLGANIYRSTVDHMDRSFTDRTSYAYVTQKLRQNDESAVISVSDFDGIQACVLTNDINNTIYNTYIYEYDGHLCELLARADMDMSPADGTKIMELTGFGIEQVSPALLKISITTPDGTKSDLYVSTHAENTKE